MTETAPTITGLAPFVLAGPELDVALDFYENKLGFTRLWVGPGIAGLKRGEGQVILQQYDNKSFADNFQFCVYVKNIEQLYEEYRTKGIEKIGPLEMKPWGNYEFHLIDPAGVCIHFVKVE